MLDEGADVGAWIGGSVYRKIRAIKSDRDEVGDFTGDITGALVIGVVVGDCVVGVPVGAWVVGVPVGAWVKTGMPLGALVKPGSKSTT